ncbi:MAG TPA: CBS domain-containing protein [Bacteroidia bacterium]|jgi:CBS domain-containing protein|nr:CBS domain-containing protein [Bacteroidia bacterium]
MKTVREIMVTTPKYCEAKTSLQSVAEEMTRSNIGSLPVVDENKKLVGMITDRDICLAAGSSKKELSSLKVHEVLGKNPLHTISPEDDLSSALRIMRLKQVGRLPVVDREKRLQGVISLNHIVRHTYGESDESEIEWAGDENVIKTLHALSNRKLEPAL